MIIHCFSLSDRVEECVERGWYCSFAGNVTYPKATDLQRAAAEVPDELLLVETDAPFLSPQERRSKPNEPAYVTATARFLAELRGIILGGDGAPPGAQRRAPVRLVSEVRASLDRMSRHGIRPNRELGQNFLVDDNMLEVIGRTAELDPDDVVLEIGGGLGVLSAYLAPARAPPARGRDRREARAGAARGARGNGGSATLYIARRDGAAPRRPRPAAEQGRRRTCPTASRRPAILRTIEELPEVDGLDA